jgi:hypothetical protein
MRCIACLPRRNEAVVLRNATRTLGKNGNKVRLSKLGEARDECLMKGFRESGCRIEEVCFGLWVGFLEVALARSESSAYHVVQQFPVP